MDKKQEEVALMIFKWVCDLSMKELDIECKKIEKRNEAFRKKEVEYFDKKVGIK